MNTMHLILGLFCQSVYQSPCTYFVTRENHTEVLALLDLLLCIAAY